MNTHIQNILNIAAGIILVIAFIFIIICSYLLFIEDNPPQEIRLPMQVDKSVYEPGDEILVTANYCRYTSAAATRYVTYINKTTGRLFPLEPTEVNSFPVSPRNCDIIANPETATIAQKLPASLTTGDYVRHSKLEFHVNIMANRTIELETETFRVVVPEE